MFAPPPVDRPTIELRDYQQACLDSIARHLEKGRNRLLVAIATGGGKTIVIGQLPDVVGLGDKRMLVLAHREELLDQARDKIGRCNPRLSIGIEQAQRRASDSDQVVVASVQSLQRKRLERLDPANFGLVVTDEAHHATAPTYTRIYEHFGVLRAPARCPHIGVTATPNRGDGTGLQSVFGHIAFRRGMLDLIEAGYLSRVRGFRIDGGAELGGVKISRGDFAIGDLSAAVNTGQRNAEIVRAYLDHGGGGRAVVFAVDVQHAHDVAAAFEADGIPAGVVSGETPKDKRRETLARFSAGDLRVVSNCAVLTEGWDEPRVEVVIMARPTKSGLLYQQCVGRGTRLAEGKEHLTVIDMADNSERHSLATIGSLFGLPSKFDAEGKDLAVAKAEIDELAERAPWLDAQRILRAGDIAIAATRADLFVRDEQPGEISAFARLAWLPVQQGQGYRIGVPPDRDSGDRTRHTIVVEPTLIDSWRVVRHTQPFRAKKQAKEIDEQSTLEDAIAVAERWVRKWAPHVARMQNANAGWRGQPASDKQRALLERRGIAVPEDLTKGQASRWLDMVLR